MRRFCWFTGLLLVLMLYCCNACAVTALPLTLYAGEFFAYAVPQEWEACELEGMQAYMPPEGKAGAYIGALLTVEEVDVSDYAPFEAEVLYQGLSASLSDKETPVCENIVIDGHKAVLVELSDAGGCLCTVLYCRGVTVLALSITMPDTDLAAARSLLLNLARYTVYIGN